MPHHEQTHHEPGAHDLGGHEQTGDARRRDRPPGPELTRRTMVTGTGVLAVTAALAACSSYGEQTAPPAATGNGAAPPPAAPPGAPPPPPGAEEGLARTTDIPVGGGEVFRAEKVVVTQPEPAQWRAFDATCTHQGCTVGSVEDGTINCPCHGSKFAIADGSVVEGPARRPLPPRDVEVDGDWVRLA